MKRLAMLAIALSVAVSPATAQQDLLNACGPGSLTVVTSPALPAGVQVPAEVRDQFGFLCGQVANALSNVQPSIGIAFSGGNHTLGTASTIGRRLGFFPRISVTARVNAALADVPDLFGGFSPTVTDAGQVDPVPTTNIPVASLQGDVVIGLFNGFSFGPAVGGVGAVDLLGSVSFIPAVQEVQDAIGLEEDIVNIGIGARIGILKQGLLAPGISVSGMYRNMGAVTFGDLNAPAPAAFSSDLSVISLRAGVSKGLLIFDVALGAGYDIYSSDTRFNWDLAYTCPASRCGTSQDFSLQPSEPVSGTLETAAWNLHGNVGLSLLVLDLVGEVGYQQATDVLDVQSFQDAGLPTQSPTTELLEGGRFFASFGLRLTI